MFARRTSRLNGLVLPGRGDEGLISPVHAEWLAQTGTTIP
jgi:hypothetical protein